MFLVSTVGSLFVLERSRKKSSFAADRCSSSKWSSEMRIDSVQQRFYLRIRTQWTAETKAGPRINVFIGHCFTFFQQKPNSPSKFLRKSRSIYFSGCASFYVLANSFWNILVNKSTNRRKYLRSKLYWKANFNFRFPSLTELNTVRTTKFSSVLTVRCDTRMSLDNGCRHSNNLSETERNSFDHNENSRRELTFRIHFLFDRFFFDLRHSFSVTVKRKAPIRMRESPLCITCMHNFETAVQFKRNDRWFRRSFQQTSISSRDFLLVL